MNNDTSLSAFVLVLVAIGMLLLIICIPTLAGALECQPRPDGSGYWQYRLIDGERCWYIGRRVLPKSQLHWPKKKGDPIFSAHVKTVRSTEFNEIDAQAGNFSGPIIMFPELTDELDALKRWLDSRWAPSAQEK